MKNQVQSKAGISPTNRFQAEVLWCYSYVIHPSRYDFGHVSDVELSGRLGMLRLVYGKKKDKKPLSPLKEGFALSRTYRDDLQRNFDPTRATLPLSFIFDFMCSLMSHQN